MLSTAEHRRERSSLGFGRYGPMNRPLRSWSVPMMSCLENGRRSHWTPKTSSPPATTWVMKGMLLYWSHDGRRRQGGCWGAKRTGGAPRALGGLFEGGPPPGRNADVQVHC